MINNIFGAFSSPQSWLTSLVRGWDWGDGREAKTLTDQKALSYAPIWYGVNKIAGHIGQLPVCVYKRLEKGAERDRTHQVHRVMRKPNAYQTSIVYREQIATHSLLDGNGRSAIVRRGGQVTELIPLLPENTTTVMIEGVKVHGTRPHADDRLRLFFNNIEGDNASDGLILLDDSDVCHIPGLSLNGITGVALKDVGSRNIGTSINAEKRLASQMENGFSGNLMLNAPAGVFRKESDAKEFLEAFEKRHNSPNKAGKPGLLREGITANILAMNNKDAEMIDNRRFQRQDAALYLGLESILGDDASVSYNSLEQKNLAYLMNCLNRWLCRWEEELEFKLLPKKQFYDESYFIRFNTGALLKSDFQATVAALSTLVTSTIYSRNEAREKLDMNPVEGGDDYENPAITPGKVAPNDPTVDPKKMPKTTAESNKAVQQAHIKHLIGVEANRIKEGAIVATNFISWMDNFYSKKFESTFADNLEAISLDRDEARIHCAESRKQLLDVCDVSQPETLVTNVEKCVSTWKSRSDRIGINHV